MLRAGGVGWFRIVSLLSLNGLSNTKVFVEQWCQECRVFERSDGMSDLMILESRKYFLNFIYVRMESRCEIISVSESQLANNLG